LIDLHSHILPGLDDGAPDMETSLAMARLAVADGVRTIVATPHVNTDFDYDLAEITRRSGELNVHLARAEVPLAVLAGAEIAVARLSELTDDMLGGLCLGASKALLVESPYAQAADFLDELLFDLQVRGFQPLLAHPERCPIFQQDVDRLKQIVERGILCCVTAGSMGGAFGSTVQKFVLRMFREGLVHDVSSDAHDHRRRRPVLTTGFERAERELPGIVVQRDWYTRAAPTAILAGEAPPPRPDPPAGKRSFWRRLTRRA
jgi:protein-tyrosine phosphatase